jgi:hypothetical protein
MRQNGWLDFAYGVWHPVLEDDDYPVRYWGDMNSALAELGSEGWAFVSGPMSCRLAEKVGGRGIRERAVSWSWPRLRHKTGDGRCNRALTS